MGLEYYGRTYLRYDGIKVFKEVLYGWIKIFEQAPFIIELNTGFDCENNRLCKTKVEKNIMVEQLKSVYNLCEQALTNNYIIVHFGI